MSMSTGIVGFIPPDEKWKKMKAIWDSCEEAGVNPPKEVEDFFGGEPPDDNGREVDFEYDLKILKEWSDDSGQGYELNVDDIPKDVKILRFYNSW